MNAQPAIEYDLGTLTELPAQRSSEAISSVSVRVHRNGRWTVVEVAGEMDQQVVALVAEAIGDDTNHVVFDLHAVTFMDASGLGLLVELRCRAYEEGGSVRLVAPSRSARRLLTLTGCIRTFRTFDSLEEAILTPAPGHLASA